MCDGHVGDSSSRLSKFSLNHVVMHYSNYGDATKFSTAACMMLADRVRRIHGPVDFGWRNTFKIRIYG